MLKLPSLLVLNSFRGHLISSMEPMLVGMRIDPAVIPRGLTSVLHQLDVNINKPFKDNLHKLYVEWMASRDHCLTPTGQIKRPSLELTCQWICAAWDMGLPISCRKALRK